MAIDPADTALMIFMKNPRRGQVKTRLAATLGQDAALGIYHRLLAMTEKTVRAIPATKYVFYSDEVEKNDLWQARHIRKGRQQGADLGERMHRAFVHVFEAGFRSVVIIGTDCPSLEPAHLRAAYEALETWDAVLGPAADGGFYLLGLKRPVPEVFLHQSWSHDTVALRTLSGLAAQGLRCATLPILHDIDTEADWRAFQHRQRTRHRQNGKPIPIVPPA